MIPVDCSGAFGYNSRQGMKVKHMKQETLDRIRRFVADRDWDQFHTPANLAKSISIEANELLECFQWNEEDFDLEAVREELADVMVYCINMLDRLQLDPDERSTLWKKPGAARQSTRSFEGRRRRQNGTLV